MYSPLFENEFKEFFKVNDTPLKRFIQEKYALNKNKNYFKFLENFLLSYGIYAFNSFPCHMSSNYIPFINCQGKNIFGLKAGITDLTNTPMTLEKSEEEIARFLIKQFERIPLRKFENWSSE